MQLIKAALLLVALSSSPATATQTPTYQTLPSLREQATIQDSWTAKRKALIPSLLKKYSLDAWLISQREYAEETVFWSLKSAQQFSARRRTLYLYLADGAEHVWIDNTPALWGELATVLEDAAPERIAVDVAREISFASGLHVGELEAIKAGLGGGWADRFVLEPMLAVEFVGTMVAERLPWYRRLQETAWAMIGEAFSERVVEPGRTTTEDVEWWLRDKLQALNFTTWFHPAVSVVDEGFPFVSETNTTINYGDLLHVDFGVTAMGLNTDTQHLGYVLHPGETQDDVPKGLLDGLHKGNRVQDILRSNMKIGLTGNDILKASLDDAHSEGIKASIYSHPTGDWGHSAGTLIGMTNMQEGVPVLGELPLIRNTYYSVELYAEHFVPERNVTLNFALEEDVYWNGDEERWDWVYGRQEKLHLVRTPKAKQGEL